jgi:tetratricopeptide (TPR) repeat protein
MGDSALALDIESKLEELGEPSAELAYNAGVLLERSNLTEEAARCYRQAAEAKPDFAEALLNLGNALKVLGQEEEAKIYWRQAVEVKPELAQAYF